MRLLIPLIVCLLLTAAGPPAISGCGACDDSASDGTVDDAGCSYAACEERCRADAQCYGNCSAGSCHCAPCFPDADVDGEAGEDAWDADSDGDDGDGHSDVPPDVETREGGSPGVVCRKVPIGSIDLYGTASGNANRVVFPVAVASSPPPGRVWQMTMFDWDLGVLSVVDDLSDLPTVGPASRISYYPSIDENRIAFGAGGRLSDDRRVVQLRFVDLAAGTKRVLAEGSGGIDFSEALDLVVLRYPWVVWRQISEETYFYAWTGWEMNIETEEKREIIPRTLGVVDLDLLGTTAIVSTNSTVFSVDVESGDVLDLAEEGDPDQWSGVITPGWIAWLDQRAYPSGDWFSPYGTQVWGMNRETREVVPLVDSPGMHGSRLSGEGDWLAYTDQRDGSDAWSDTDREQNIYALHLPTRTEICVENWDGYQLGVEVYEGVGETRVLFFHEIAFGTAYDLWDCNLPVPASGGP